MTESVKSAGEIANEKLDAWAADDRAVQLESDGHARHRYREIIARMAVVVEFRSLVEKATQPPRIGNREVVERGLLHDVRGRWRAAERGVGLSPKEAELQVQRERPELASAGRDASALAENDGRDLAQLRRDLDIPAERVDTHVGRIIEYRKLMRSRTDADRARKHREQALAEHKAAKQALELTDLNLADALRRVSDSHAQNQIDRLVHDCPVLFGGEHDYALPPAPLPGGKAPRERGLAWLGSWFGAG